MYTLNSYEEAIISATKGKQFNSFPIVSLEFYVDGFFKTKQDCIDATRLSKLALRNSWQNFNFDLLQKLEQVVIIVTTPKLEIIFASNQITKMNGYTELEILGKTPKLFQGKKTSASTSQEIRESINLGLPFEKTIVNYKKDGSTYNCLISGIPIFNSKGILSHFIAFEKTV